MNAFIDAFLFFLPAGFANMAPIFANKIPGLNRWKTPLDLGKSYKGERILGDNKTFRGLVSGVVLAAIVASIEAGWAYHALPEDKLWFVLAGGLMGFGALMGDAVESFLKRRAGIKPGVSWFPFDQTDYIIGGLLAVAPFIRWYPGLVARVFLVYFGLHVLTVYVGYKLGVRDAPI